MEIIICDDFIWFAEEMKKCLLEYVSSNPLSTLRNADIKIATSPDEVFDVVKTDKPRICIFDIDLRAEIDGIELASAIIEKYPLNTYVIYATAFDNFVTKSIQMCTRPIAYIIKNSEYKNEIARALAIVDKLFEHETKVTIGIREYRLDDLLYIEPVKGTNYINIVCISGTYTERCTITDAASVSKYLFRINKGMIVNLQKIDIIGSHVVISYKHDELECSRQTRLELQKAMELLNL